MSIRTGKKALRLAVLLGAAALAITVSGCGVDHRTTETGVSQDALSNGGEPYFDVSNVTYQVQVSRQLNPFSDDVQYFSGVKDAQHILPNQLWFGVFLWAKNQMSTPLQTADRFAIVDSEGRVFLPTVLDASINQFAWVPQMLQQNEIEPAAGTVAANASAGGGLILFKLSNSVYANRPLTLLIFPPSGGKPARVSLDL